MSGKSWKRLAGMLMLMLVGLLTGTEARSYVATAVGKLRQLVKRQVSIDFEIDRARQMINRLEPELVCVMEQLAAEEATVEKLQKSADDHEERLAEEESAVRTLHAAAKAGGMYVVQGRSFTNDQVRNDLKQRLKNHKVDAETLAKEREAIAVRQQGVEATQRKVAAMQQAIQRLKVDVENLQARKTAVDARQYAAGIPIDGGALSQTQSAMDEISHRLTVAEKLLHMRNSGRLDEVPVTKEELDILDQVASQLGIREEELITELPQLPPLPQTTEIILNDRWEIEVLAIQPPPSQKDELKATFINGLKKVFERFFQDATEGNLAVQ